MKNLLILILILVSSSLFSQVKTGTVVPLTTHGNKVEININKNILPNDLITFKDLFTPYTELKYKYQNEIPNFQNLSSKEQVQYVYMAYLGSLDLVEYTEEFVVVPAPACPDTCLREWEIEQILSAIKFFDIQPEEIGFSACESLGPYSEFEVIISQPLNRFGISFTVLYPTTPTTGPGSNFQRTHVVIGTDRQLLLGTLTINTEG